MKKIIVINGSAQSGKDTLVEIVRNILNKEITIKNINVISISSVDTIKEIASQLGWNGEKNNHSRKFLSDLKDCWTNYNNGPFMDIAEKINKLDSDKDWLIYVHIREYCEIQKMISKYPDTITLLVTRNNTESFNNHADQNVRDCSYNYIIENNGSLNHLKNTVETFLIDIGMI